MILIESLLWWIELSKGEGWGSKIWKKRTTNLLRASWSYWISFTNIDFYTDNNKQWDAYQMMKKNAPPAITSKLIRSSLHLCLAQKAYWFIRFDLLAICWEIDSNLTAFFTVISTFSSLCRTFSMFSFMVSWRRSSYLVSVSFWSGSLLLLKKVWVSPLLQTVAWKFKRKRSSCWKWWSSRFLLRSIFL